MGLDRCPDALCALVGLLSKDHRDALREAKRPFDRIAVTDIVRSVAALEAAHGVAPAIGLEWPPPRHWDDGRWYLDVCMAAIRAGDAPDARRVVAQPTGARLSLARVDQELRGVSRGGVPRPPRALPAERSLT